MFTFSYELNEMKVLQLYEDRLIFIKQEAVAHKHILG